MAMLFKMNDKQEQDYKVWATEHLKICGTKPDVSLALFSFKFTPSGLGNNVHVCCPCGAKQYLDDGVEL